MPDSAVQEKVRRRQILLQELRGLLAFIPHI